MLSPYHHKEMKENEHENIFTIKIILITDTEKNYCNKPLLITITMTLHV